MDPDFLRAEIDRLRAEAAQRRAAAAQYRALAQGQQVQRDVQQPIQNMVDASMQTSLSATPPPSAVQALFPKQLTAMPPEDAADLQRRGLGKGAFATEQPNAPISRDIEGALKHAGATEDVAGDQRIVLDAQGNAIATRAEQPSLGAHLAAVGPEGKASKLGAFLNVIQAPARAAATGTNLISSLLRGEQTPDLAGAATDVKQAFLNEKGNTVGEGGAVTSRGAGGGDLLRSRAQTLLRDNPDATIRDLIRPALAVAGGAALGPGLGTAAAALGALFPDAPNPATATAGAEADAIVKGGTALAGSAFPGEHPLNLDRPLRELDKNDPTFDFLGEGMMTFTDPLNFVPLDKVVAPVGKALAKGAEAIAPHVPQAVADAARALNNSPSAIASLFSGAGKAEREVKAGLAAAGETPEDAAHIAAQGATVKERVRAEQQVQNDEFMQRMRAAAPEALSTDAPMVNALQEGKGAPLVSTKPIEDQLAILAERGAKHFASLTSREQELLRPIIDAKAQGRPLLEVASPELRMSTHEIAEHLRRVEPDVVDRLFQAHPFDVAGEAERRQLKLARALVHDDRLDLQRAQRAQVLGEAVTGEGHRARPPRSTEAAFLLKKGVPEGLVRGIERGLDPWLSKPGYNPFRSRAMADMLDADIVRRAAAGLVERAKSGHLNGNPNLAMIRDFARSTEQQADRGVRTAVRREIEQSTGHALPHPEYSLDEAQHLLTKRGSKVSAFVEDPVTAAVSQKQAAMPRLMNAEIGQRMLGVVDTNDRAVVQELDDALHAPRTGAADAALLARRYENNVRKPGQFWQQKPVIANGQVVGHKLYLPDDIAKFLDKRDLTFIGEDDALGHAMPALRGKVVPRAIYGDLKDTAERLIPGVLERYANVLAKLTNWWAPIVLNSPGFHTRNAFFGMFQVFLANGADAANGKVWKLAGDVGKLAEHNGLSDAVFKYKGKDWRLADLAAEARSFGIFEGGRAADLERAAAGKVFYGDEGKRAMLARFNPSSDVGVGGGEQFFKKTVSRGMGKVMSGEAITAENAQRLFTYLNHRVNLSESADDAAKAVAKFHFDYTGSRLSKGEKVLRKFFPFYQWVKQSTVLTLEQMLRHPEKFAAVNHLYEAFSRAGEDKNVDPRLHPSYIEETGAVHAGSDPERQRWLAMERPGTQLSWAQPGQMVSGLASQLGPLPKFLAERFTGKSMFGDRPVDANFSPERASPLEYVFGMNKQNIPSYVARNMVGGIPGTVVNDVVLPQVAPEYSNQTAKATGGDDQTRLLQRLVSMVVGPRLSVTRPLDVLENNRAQWRDMFNKAIGETQERNKRSLQNRPTDFLFAR